MHVFRIVGESRRTQGEPTDSEHANSTQNQIKTHSLFAVRRQCKPPQRLHLIEQLISWACSLLLPVPTVTRSRPRMAWVGRSECWWVCWTRPGSGKAGEVVCSGSRRTGRHGASTPPSLCSRRGTNERIAVQELVSISFLSIHCVFACTAS